jgi:hypothetical protein
MMQGVLVSATRGCDGLTKEDPSKPLVREFRLVLLRNAKPLDAINGKKMFMDPLDDDRFNLFANELIKSMDHYPMHFLTHFMFACEIVGYKHPDDDTRFRWLALYEMIVHALHLHQEPEAELDKRLGWQPNDEIEEEPYP